MNAHRTVRRRVEVFAMRLQVFGSILALFAISVTAQGQEVFTNSITVRGESVTEAVPDTVTWVVVLTREAGSREAARSALAAETARVRELARSLKLRGADVEVARMAVKKSGAVYLARQTLSLTQRDLSSAASTLERLNAMRPAGLSYRLSQSHQSDIEREAQRKAVADARRHAQGLAQELGAGLGRVILVENEFGVAGAFGGGAGFSSYDVTPLEHVSAETFVNAKIKVRASVFVTYALGAQVASAG